MNYFEFYGLQPVFNIDKSALKRLFYQKSKQFHPDFHTLADATQQAAMLDMSTLNNEAFQALSDDDSRMRHVLQLHGLLEEEGSNAALPQDFLMDMMDINEAIMDLQMDFDAGQYQSVLKQIGQLEQQMQEAVLPSMQAFDANPSDAAAVLPAVKDFFLKRKYLLRIKENLSNFAPA